MPAYRNLTHSTISPYWGRAKADGEKKALNPLLAAFGLNWIPVVDVPIADLKADTRLNKRTVCGSVDKAELFIAAEPTTEYDWNLVLKPKNPHFVDVSLLSLNAHRVRQLNLDLSLFFEKSGKFLNTSDWYPDHAGAFLLEVEISPPRALLASKFNPLPCVKGACDLAHEGEQKLVSPTELCAYGPWVQEAIHGFRPEIHPAEAIFWHSSAGYWELMMLQDASRRFDASDPGTWLTVLGSADSPQSSVPAEHWVQEAMIGEFVVPIAAAGGAPRIEVIGEVGLEAIGGGGYPSLVAPRLGTTVVETDPRVQAVLVDDGASGSKQLVIRAQIRGACPDAPLRNRGAYLHLRIHEPTPP